MLPQSGRLMRNVRGDFSGWHRGRPWFLLWAVAVDVPALQPVFRQAQLLLAPWLLEGYRRQPHVTLGLCGFPLRAVDASADTCDAMALHQQVERLRAAAGTPFVLDIGGAGSFASAPYLAVQDAGRLTALRATIGLDVRLQHLQDYVPHITLGLYREAWLPAQVHASLAAVDGLPRVRMVVRELGLMAYAAADVGGPLVSVAAFDLCSRRLRCSPSAAQVLGADWLAQVA